MALMTHKNAKHCRIPQQKTIFSTLRNNFEP